MELTIEGVKQKDTHARNGLTIIINYVSAHRNISSVVPSTFAQQPDSPPTYQVGAQPNGSVVVPTDQIITPTGSQLQLSGARPNAVAFSPDRKKLAILTAGCNGCSLVSVVDLATNTVQQTLNPNDGDAPPDGIVYSQDGRQLFMSDTNGEIIVANVDSAGQLTLANKIEIPAPDGGTSYPIGLALSVDGKSLYVALSRLNSIGVIDVATRTLVSQISVGNAPYGITVIGDKAYVRNEGGRAATAGEFTNNSSGTQIVADPNSGGSITGTVSVVNLRAGQTVKTIPVGLQPTRMTVYGRYLFVANTNSDSVSVIDTVADEAVKTIGIQAFPNAPFGSTRTGVAFSITQPWPFPFLPSSMRVLALSGLSVTGPKWGWRWRRQAE